MVIVTYHEPSFIVVGMLVVMQICFLLGITERY